MSSGIKVSKKAAKLIEDISSRKGDASIRAVRLYIGMEDKLETIVLDEDFSFQDSSGDLNEYLAKVSDTDPCYIVIRTEYNKITHGGPNVPTHMVLIKWCSDNANIKKKMTVASSLTAVKRCCIFKHTALEVSDKDDMTVAYIFNEVKRDLAGAQDFEGIPIDAKNNLKKC